MYVICCCGLAEHGKCNTDEMATVIFTVDIAWRSCIGMFQQLTLSFGDACSFQLFSSLFQK